MSKPAWIPSEERLRDAQLTHYIDWLARERGLQFDDYDALWRWSTDDQEAFWRSLWDYFDIQSDTAIDDVLADATMPGARWFTGTTVNYATQVFRNRTSERPAIIFQSEQTALEEISWSELEAKVAAVAGYFQSVGIRPGDRVVAYLPNVPEAVVAFLASASVGAIWSMCAPDLGVDGVLDRFRQIRPKLLIASCGYSYSGKDFDRSNEVKSLVAGLESVESVVAVGGETPTFDDIDIKQASWGDICRGEHPLNPMPLPFDHPLWILFSSGTTGTPKAIVHGHGGIVIEHLKSLHFHLDLGASDRFFWYSSTAWMMWNFQIGGLLTGASICLYDGNPGWPDLNRLWQFADEGRVSFFGAGAAFFDGCRNASIDPKREYALTALRTVGSTGSPLLPEAYRWIYDNVGDDIYLLSISGGSDFASGFVGGVPILPVRIGEMSCRCLGAAVAAYNDEGAPIIGEVGELVCTKPMPSMPLSFWGDDDGSRYRESYFDHWPGVWRHGDWIKITEYGGAIIYGRSDATINRYGIRMGTSELYAAIEELPDVIDSLVVDLEFLGRDSYMPLFVVLKPGATLDEDLIEAIRQRIGERLSRRHVPNDVFQVHDVPRTFSGKKLEIPVRRLLLGQDVEKVINKDTMGNPDSIDFFIEFAKRLQS